MFSVSRRLPLFWIWFPCQLSSGCDGPCEGADCGELYPRAALGRLDAEQLGSGVVAPAEAAAVLEGAEEDGFDWAAAGATDGVVIGVPSAGELRYWDGRSEEAVVLSSEAGAAERYGAAVALGPGPGGATRLLVSAPDASAGPLVSFAGRVDIHERVDIGGAGLGAPDRRLYGGAAGDRSGQRLLACGDLDADALPDWAVGSAWAQPTGAPLLPGVLYLGLSRSLSADREIELAGLPMLVGEDLAAGFGTAASCATSLDDDDVSELVVGTPYADVPDGVLRDAAGTVAVWQGAIGFPAAAPALLLAHEEPDAWFGAALAVGDLDGDGLAELVVGAPGEDRPGEGGGGLVRDGAASDGTRDVAGAVYVFDGEALRAELRTPSLVADPQPVRELYGEFARGRFGASLLLADLDGDGILDLVIGAPGTNLGGNAASTRAGAATVWFGPWTDWPEVQFASDAPVTIGAERQYLETGRLLAAAAPTDGPAELFVLTRQPSLDAP